MGEISPKKINAEESKYDFLCFTPKTSSLNSFPLAIKRRSIRFLGVAFIAKNPLCAPLSIISPDATFPAYGPVANTTIMVIRIVPPAQYAFCPPAYMASGKRILLARSTNEQVENLWALFHQLREIFGDFLDLFLAEIRLCLFNLRFALRH